jgi:TolB-like protein
MSGDPEQEYFSDGITEDIITELSRFRQLFVIARNSSFTFKGQNVDVKEVASKLGVQYVVEGSVRKAGSRVRITAQLIDAATGSHVWANRFDRTLDDIFAVQDEVVAAIVSTLPSQIQKADFARQQRRPSDVRAYDLALRASDTLDNLEGIKKSIALLEQALDIEPDYATAHTWLAAAYCLEVDYQLMPVTDTAAERIMKHARRGVELDVSDDRGFQLLSDLCLFVEQDLVEARIHAEHAMSLNPNSTNTVAWMGYIHNCYGESELAKELCERALRQDPLAPGWVKFLQGVVYFDAGQLDLAIGMFLASKWDEKWPHLAAAYALSGQLDKAQQIAMRQRQTWSDINPENLDQRIQGSLDQVGGWYTHGNKDGSFENGVRLAGLIS